MTVTNDIRALLAVTAVLLGSVIEQDAQAQSNPRSPLTFRDDSAQHYKLTARASRIDLRVKAHPEIDFLIKSNIGQPADLQHAAVDTRVAPRGKLVIWLMGHNEALFDRINSYGLHAIRVHYANRWFSICCRENPVGEHCRGNIRLEAATGQDFSDDVEIPKPDGMMERAYQFVKWLAKENRQAGWSYFLTKDGNGLRWDDVIMSGSSHGSTTAARFAKFQKVSRVVALCGPRDQLQSWQSLPSATPENRYFGFSHVLDGGWVGDHYCRSWELIGMHKFGSIVNVDRMKAPYGNTRRLITDFDVKGDARRAHSSVVPGSRAKKGCVADIVDLLDYVEFAEEIHLLLSIIDTREHILILFPHVTDMTQPIVNQTQLVVLHRGFHSATPVVTTNDDVFHLQDGDRVFKNRQTIEITVHDNIADVAVDQHLAWSQPGNLI